MWLCMSQAVIFRTLLEGVGIRGGDGVWEDSHGPVIFLHILSTL